MSDFFIHFAINSILTVLRFAFKSEHAKAELQEYLLEVRDQITLLYPTENVPPVSDVKE